MPLSDLTLTGFLSLHRGDPFLLQNYFGLHVLDARILPTGKISRDAMRRRMTVGPMVFGLVDTCDGGDLPFYVRNGQALAWFHGVSAAVRDVEALDEIGHALQVTWTHRW